MWGRAAKAVEKDFISVRDAGNFFPFLLAEMQTASQKSYEVINLGSGRATSLKELADAVQTATEKPLTIAYQPAAATEVFSTRLDITRAKKTGWEPIHSSPEALAKSESDYQQKQLQKIAKRVEQNKTQRNVMLGLGMFGAFAVAAKLITDTFSPAPAPSSFMGMRSPTTT